MIPVLYDDDQPVGWLIDVPGYPVLIYQQAKGKVKPECPTPSAHKSYSAKKSTLPNTEPEESPSEKP